MLSELYSLINLHFNEQELRELCFFLNIRYDNLAGYNKSNKVLAMELVEHCDRHGILSNLLTICQRERPHIKWHSNNRAVSQSELILIVEDDPDWQEHIMSILKSANYTVEVVSEYTSAIRILSHIKPSALILDANLGGAEGLRLIPKAKGLGIPVIVVTGSTDSDTANIALVDQGAEAFFSKGNLVDHTEKFLQRIAEAIMKYARF